MAAGASGENPQIPAAPRAPAEGVRRGWAGGGSCPRVRDRAGPCHQPVWQLAGWQIAVIARRCHAVPADVRILQAAPAGVESAVGLPVGTLALWHFGRLASSVPLDARECEGVPSPAGRWAGWHYLALPRTTAWCRVGTLALWHFSPVRRCLTRGRSTEPVSMCASEQVTHRDSVGWHRLALPGTEGWVRWWASAWCPAPGERGWHCLALPDTGEPGEHVAMWPCDSPALP
jgi:hypothetical protein